MSGSDDGTKCKRDYDTRLLVGEPWKGDGKTIAPQSLSPSCLDVSHKNAGHWSMIIHSRFLSARFLVRNRHCKTVD
ncbi:hypothetical protein K503DRAFT_767471, partial [Rhizopogon vinicolor AM-OR11-026]